MYPFHYNSLSALPRYANCAYPPSTQGRELQRLRFYYTYELQCVPSACQWDEGSLATVLNCSRAAQTDPSASFMFHRPEPVIDEIPKIPPSLFWQSIILSDLELEDDDIWLKHLTGLKLADLSGNRLTKWPTAGLPTSMETLVLNNNVITHLPRLAAVSRYLPNLKTVDLRNNKIVSLDPHELQTIFSIKYFRLSGNLLECNCHLMALVTWAKAEDSNSFNDKNELLCFYPPKLNGVRLRDLVDDEFCAKAAKLNPKMWVAYAMSLIVLMIIAILIMFVNKRRRYKAQILEGFQKLLLEEASFTVKTEQHGELEVDINGEAFAYDAFVATDECSQGTEFLEELIQELEEKRKHCLCVSIRDFVPGIDMAENIVSSIRTSKRVILLMSKSFVQSPWCQYGVQVALAELHQRQRKLLIPIILNDLDADTSSCLTVRTFTSLIPTYKAPKKKASQREWEKFWNSVENVMN